MLFSSNLLKKYISLDIEPQSLMSNMTLHACEVEHVEVRVLPELVVIGYVTETKKHPNADSLTICKLDCGSHGTYQICTAADNIVANIFVPVALPGCYLPAIDLTIGARQMRGEDSNGMICAKVELGINEDADQHGIWILDEDFSDLNSADLWVSLSKKYEWLNNTLLDVDNKTINNRPDLTGLLGMAIEMRAIFTNLAQRGENNVIKQQNIAHELSEHYPGRVLELLSHAQSPRQQVEVKTDWCSVYSLLQLDAITVRRSLFYDRLSLIDSGLQSKNNWVDFSNLFMTIVGQPIHIFDADKIKGTIVVRNASDGEHFVDLFGASHSLVAQDIVIADESGVIALAGVIGGASTAVSDSTTNIVIEMAHFDPVATRRTSMRIGVRTDAVMRFEKTISPLLSLTSLSLILDVLKQYAPMLGEYTIVGATSIMTDEIRTKAMSGQYITIDPEECIRLLFGRAYDETTDKSMMIDILKLLGYEVEANRDVRIPRWRWSDDMNIAHDIYEEIVRIYGYNRIEPVANKEVIAYHPFRPAIRINRIIEQILVHSHHADQLQTYSRCDESFFDLLWYDRNNLVKLRNAVAPELSYLRPSILPNLLQAITKNSKIYDSFTLFDSGQTRNKSENFSSFLNKQSFETTKIGIVSYKKSVSEWMDDTVLKMKEMITDIVQWLGISGVLQYAPTSLSHFHPKKQGTISIVYGDQSVVIGMIGQYHPRVLESLKIDSHAQVVGVELQLETLEQVVTSQGQSFETTSHYQTIQDQIVTRDISFVIAKDQPFWSLVQVVESLDNVAHVEVFDLYQGEHLPEGKKSIALTLTIVGDGTWTSDQINEVLNQAIVEVEKIGGQLR